VIELALFIVANLLIVAGMGGIAWSMPQHHQSLVRQPPVNRIRRRLRGVGCLLLAGALIPCVAGWGSSIGLVLWIGLQTVGVLVVAGFLALSHKGGLE